MIKHKAYNFKQTNSKGQLRPLKDRTTKAQQARRQDRIDGRQ